MTVSVQYRLGVESGTSLGDGDKWPSGESCVTFWLGCCLSLVCLFVEELEDASSGRGELGDEGSF